MTFQWLGNDHAASLLEIHELRAEQGAGDELLRLLLASGLADFGGFTVSGVPDRLIVLRGFADRQARRAAYDALFARPGWRALRATLAALTRHHQVILGRAIRPQAGLAARPLGPLQLLISELRDREAVGDYHLWLRLLLRKAGSDPLASFASLEAINDVPAVPVLRDRTHHVAILPGAGGAAPDLPDDLLKLLRFPPERLHLTPEPLLVA